MRGDVLALGAVAGLAVAGLARRGSRDMVRPQTLPEGMRVSITETPAYQWHPDYRDLDRISITLTPEGCRWWKRGEIGGHIVLLRTRWNLWEVDTVEASKGYGPLLYDLALELAALDGADGVVPDRSGISDAAERVWIRYEETRPEVTHADLPADYPDRDKHTRRHRPHLDRVYRKQGTPFLDALRQDGKIVVCGTGTALTQRVAARGSAVRSGRLDPEGARFDKRIAVDARAQLAARGVAVPAPTTELGTGGDARVFNTTRKGVVVRVGRGRSVEKQALLLDEDFEGGVVPVLAMTEVDGHVVSWKERVDTDPEGFLRRQYGGHDDPRFREIVQALVGLYHASAKDLAVLARYPETKGLARAIRRGLPTDDIDLTLNLGVTKDGRVVAYDL